MCNSGFCFCRHLEAVRKELCSYSKQKQARKEISVSGRSSQGMPELFLIIRMLRKGQMSACVGRFTVQLTRQSYIP